MRTIPALAAALALISGASPSQAASSPRDRLVVSASWLAEHLRDPGLVLLHVGDKAEYEASHIPGARYVALSDLSVSDRTGAENGLVLEMLPAETLRERLQSLGISDDSRVVVYFGKDWVSPATRVMFTLDYAGLGDRSSLLDGGQPAWEKSGQAVTAVVPAPAAGTLSPLAVRSIVVDKEYVRDHVGASGEVLVDARDAAFFQGVETGGGKDHPHRTGHIKGAVSIPFSEITDGSLTLRSTEDLAARFEKAGVKEGDTVIAYCHLGQQATAVLFAARTLGHRVLLYDGSFQDWTRFPDYPVEKPSTPGPVVKEPVSVFGR